MKKPFIIGVAMLALPCLSDVTIENDCFRLNIGDDAIVKSLKLKATGEELLMKGSAIPFAAITQNRPYDNELQFVHVGRPFTIPANGISREGDLLKIRFAEEFHVLKVRIAERPSFVALVPEGTDYEQERFGLKRKTEIDAVEFVRLPIAMKKHFGECANVTWNEQSAVAVMGLKPETFVNASSQMFSASTHARVGLWGQGAAIVATTKDRFLDCVDAMEREYNLPRGVENRRREIRNWNYLWMWDVNPDNVGEFIKVMKQGKIRIGLVTYNAFASTCGHYRWKKAYPNQMADLKRVVAELRKNGITPGLHIHYNKVSTDDDYVSGGRPDPRLAVHRELTLARPLAADDVEAWLNCDSQVMRMDKGRKLVLAGEEMFTYEKAEGAFPCHLTGLKRGEFNTKKGAYPANAYVRHLDVDNWFRFVRCDPDSGILDEIADRLANIIDECGFDMLYFDGAEDVPEPYWYHVGKAQERVWSKLKHKPLAAETALRSHWGWHLFNRGNAFDLFDPQYARVAAEKYVLPCAKCAADDFSTVNFGWLGVKCPPDHARFMAEKAREFDAPLSIQLHSRDLKERPEQVAALMKAIAID